MVDTNLPVSLLAQKSPLSPFYEHTHHHYNSCFTDEPKWAGSSPAFFLPLFQTEPLVDKWLKFYCTSDALPATKPTALNNSEFLISSLLKILQHLNLSLHNFVEFLKPFYSNCLIIQFFFICVSL